MSEHGNRAERIVYTVGHSNHPLETFLSLLTKNGIELLVDTRSHPHSRYAPHFSLPELKPAVTAAGIRYLYLGKELGGRPEGEVFYDAEGHVLYGLVAETPAFLEGIAHLEEKADAQRLAIFCSEENPSVCHRRLLIGRVLAERGTLLRHIRSDGRLQTEAQLRMEEEAARNAGGLSSSCRAVKTAPAKSAKSAYADSNVGKLFRPQDGWRNASQSGISMPASVQRRGQEELVCAGRLRASGSSESKV